MNDPPPEFKNKEIWSPKYFFRDQCVRETFYYSLPTGALLGTFRFMFTSNVMASVNFSLKSITFALPFFLLKCGYQRNKNAAEIRKHEEQVAQLQRTFGEPKPLEEN